MFETFKLLDNSIIILYADQILYKKSWTRKFQFSVANAGLCDIKKFAIFDFMGYITGSATT